jgi:hypothetical protein
LATPIPTPSSRGPPKSSDSSSRAPSPGFTSSSPKLRYDRPAIQLLLSLAANSAPSQVSASQKPRPVHSRTRSWLRRTNHRFWKVGSGVTTPNRVSRSPTRMTVSLGLVEGAWVNGDHQLHACLDSAPTIAPRPTMDSFGPDVASTRPTQRSLMRSSTGSASPSTRVAIA